MEKFKIAKRFVPVLFVVVFGIILLLVFGFDWIDYRFNRNLFFPNIVAIIIAILIALTIILIYKKLFKTEISDQLFKRILIGVALGCFLLQLIIIYNMYFFTGWDVKAVSDIADNFIQNGTVGQDFYLTIYPNNLFLVFFLILIRSVPFFGSHTMFLLAINALLVNLSIVMACLTLRRVCKSNRISLLAFAVAIPLLILSPWMVIPYSDTFAILLPITLLYIYLKPAKKWYDYFIFSTITVLGYYIKPTVVIVAIAILVVEFLHHGFKIINFKKVTLFIVGAAVILCSKFAITKILDFEKAPGIGTVNFVHYLAMGQNDQTLGTYSEEDNTFTGIYGTKGNIEKFWKRLSGRSLPEQLEFFSKKTLVNFNDGSFSWGIEGGFFNEIPDRTNSFSKILGSFYYATGENYRIFLQFEQIVWVAVLAGCIFIFSKNNSKSEQVVMLSILGITFFLTIFESRTRYLYCYSPIFIACAILGWYKLYTRIKSRL